MRDLFADDPDPQVSGRSHQFALTRLEVFNWGTFSGLHTLGIAPEGHLFTGKSGSGKSTLLDAHAALTTPPLWKDYNVAAAQEGERRSGDRTDLSYVRGAWSQQTDEDDNVLTQYLRPDTTWSAAAETYRNGNQDVVVLGVVLWVRGRTTAPGDVQKSFFFIQRPFSLKELEFFPHSDFSLRQFKTQIPDLTLYPDFSAFDERFRGALGIEERLALKLLHKTQSAKNLGDLNVFLRDFMLDPPQTFELRNRLVQEFQTLNEAHGAVVRARQQIEVLSQARVAWDEVQTLRGEQLRLQTTEAALGEVFNRKRRAWVRSQVAEASAQRETELTRRAEAEQRQNDADLALRSLEERREGAGGRRLAELERSMQEWGRDRDRAAQRRPGFEAACRKWGRPVPQSGEAFAALHAEAGQAQGELERQKGETSSLIEARSQEKWRAGELVAEARRALEAWSGRRTRIDPALQKLRDDLCRFLKVDEGQLPFFGELVEVLPTESKWRGALERVLGGVSSSLLVPQALFPALRDYVDTAHLGQRLRYETEPSWTRAFPDSAPNALFRKVSVKEGPFREWVEGLIQTRYNFACVEQTSELAGHAQAVTLRGQIKSSAHRYEKDDRRPLNEERYWVLGFDNADQVRVAQQEVQKRATDYSAAQSAVNQAQEQRDTLESRLEGCRDVARARWEDVDVGGPAQRIDEARRLVRQLTEENQELKVLDAQIGEARRALQDARAAFEAAVRAGGALQERLTVLNTKRALWGEDGDPPSEEILSHLSALVPDAAEPETEEQIDQAEKTAHYRLNARRRTVVECTQEALHQVLNAFRDFLARWNEYSGDLQAAEAQAGEFFTLLEKLEDDGLPQYEGRFRQLLTEQSDNNLVALNTQLEQERRAIRSRLSAVNEGLKEALFNHSLRSHLVIKMEDRRLQEVADFRRRIADALSFALAGDPDQEERRYAAIDSLVKDLSSTDPELVRWQKQVLDVRHHVEFVARELSETGEELNVYRSGAGKSGGQRQLLSASVLAAALRYQLGGREKDLPTFRTVVLDEAFDKADMEFTRSALTTFQRLGFQLILATPLKSLETMQTFVGGAVYVSIRDQKQSILSQVSYEKAERLPDEVP